MNNPFVQLKPQKDSSVKRFHPWVFSGAIDKKTANLSDGDLVHVYNHEQTWLGCGHYHDGSIMVRIISFDNPNINQTFWVERLQSAYNLREKLNLTDNLTNNCYRLIHGEGDLLSGLIVDIYNQTAVIQAHSIGMHKQIEEIADGLRIVYQHKLKAIYNKSQNSLPDNYGCTVKDGFIFPQEQTNVEELICENGIEFAINVQTGQKTGFFLDQKVNRQLLKSFSKDATVLNTFCYSGGFSLYALQAGAKLVHSVDSSEKAIALVEKNVALLNNETYQQKHQSYCQDVLKFISQSAQQYDIVILDPPAYAKSLSKTHNAIQAYKRLNIAGLGKVKKGGFLFTFSCSQVVSKELFEGAVLSAAIEAGRNVRIVQHLSQSQDHPINIFHPESNYLKGLLLYIE
jgi:23S rRNA (cytosine1962-C5)-methyltransferase